MKVLIVEDDKFLRDLVAKKLENEKITFKLAVDGEQGLSLAIREKPDLILLDILLPGLDGYGVLERIRATPELKQTIIIMLSNFGQREDIEKAMKLGANLFLIKAAITLDEVVEKAKELLAVAPT